MKATIEVYNYGKGGILTIEHEGHGRALIGDVDGMAEDVSMVAAFALIEPMVRRITKELEVVARKMDE